MKERPDTIHLLEREQVIEGPLLRVFPFFGDARNLEAITPPFLRFRILTEGEIEMREGARIDYALSLFGVPISWRTVITDWQWGVRFVDEQESGPYAYWRHTHEFEPRGDQTVMRDVVEYKEPLGVLGTAAHWTFVRPTLERIFDYRGQQIRRHL